jgi:YVTN family beta-propeller protein
MTMGASVSTGSDPVEAAFDPAGTSTYVTNQFSSTVTILDAAGTITGTVPVRGDPWRVRVSKDGSRVFVTANNGVLSVIDAAARAVVDSYDLGVPINGIALSPNDSLLYVTAFTSGRLYEVNWRTRTVRELVTGGAPQDVAVSSTGDEMFIANESGYLEVRNVATGALVRSVQLAGGGFGLALSPDNAQIWVTLSNTGAVQVISRATWTVLSTIQTGGTPRRVAFDLLGTTAVVANEAGWVDFIR